MRFLTHNCFGYKIEVSYSKHYISCHEDRMDFVMVIYHSSYVVCSLFFMSKPCWCQSHSNAQVSNITYQLAQQVMFIHNNPKVTPVTFIYNSCNEYLPLTSLITVQSHLNLH